MGIQMEAVKTLSHPSRVRGLKFYIDKFEELRYKVAPFAGAWIEIGLYL